MAGPALPVLTVIACRPWEGRACRVLLLLESKEGFKISLFIGEFKTYEQEFKAQEEKNVQPKGKLSKSAMISNTKLGVVVHAWRAAWFFI